MLLVRNIPLQSLEQLLLRFNLQLVISKDNLEIPGSHWGGDEAGLIKNTLYVRIATPIHSALHESCHYICMDPQRREQLHTDAGGDYDEENAVCYLQILLADFLPQFSKQDAFRDMDDWGYSFRLGSTQTWFENDADDARQWLINNSIIDQQQQPLWQCRATTNTKNILTHHHSA